jgi:hypothetical protein
MTGFFDALAGAGLTGCVPFTFVISIAITGAAGTREQGTIAVAEVFIIITNRSYYTSGIVILFAGFLFLAGANCIAFHHYVLRINTNITTIARAGQISTISPREAGAGAIAARIIWVAISTIFVTGEIRDALIIFAMIPGIALAFGFLIGATVGNFNMTPSRPRRWASGILISTASSFLRWGIVNTDPSGAGTRASEFRSIARIIE